jgi:hypothetical protein
MKKDSFFFSCLFCLFVFILRTRTLLVLFTFLYLGPAPWFSQFRTKPISTGQFQPLSFCFLFSLCHSGSETKAARAAKEENNAVAKSEGR